jgi:IS30 family transposase
MGMMKQEKLQMLRAYRDGWPLAKISKKFGVSKSAVCHAARRADLSRRIYTEKSTTSNISQRDNYEAWRYQQWLKLNAS